jgi:hypothetical protein
MEAFSTSPPASRVRILEELTGIPSILRDSSRLTLKFILREHSIMVSEVPSCLFPK